MRLLRLATACLGLILAAAPLRAQLFKLDILPDQMAEPPQEAPIRVQNAPEKPSEEAPLKDGDHIRKVLKRDPAGNVSVYETFHGLVVYAPPVLPEKAILPCPKYILRRHDDSYSLGASLKTQFPCNRVSAPAYSNLRTRCHLCNGTGERLRPYTLSERIIRLAKLRHDFDQAHLVDHDQTALAGAYVDASPDQLYTTLSPREYTLIAMAHPRPCPTCTGTGYIFCKKCLGAGRIKAPLSSATQLDNLTDDEGFISCKACDGKGSFPCKKCTYGHLPRCKRCKGTGLTHVPAKRNQPAHTEPCKSCNGEGRR